MRIGADGWTSGEHLAVRENSIDSQRAFSAVSDFSISHLTTCACAGCISEKFANFTPDDNSQPSPVQPVIEPPDIPGNNSTPHNLVIGTTDTGNISTFGDHDWFRVELVAGQNYVFTLTPDGATPLEDTYLQLYNSAGGLVAFDDDGGVGTNSVLRWTATTSGTFYINARAWEPEDGPFEGYTGTGTYEISAAIGAAQNPLDTINLGVVAPMNIQVWFSPQGQTHTFGPPGQQTSVTAQRAWTTEERNAVMAALQTYSAVTPLTFSVANTQGEAEWLLTIADLEAGTLGWFATSGGLGYGAFAPDGTGWTTGVNGGLNAGGLGFATLIHEFGHGLGLAHPHDNGGVSEVMQGVLDPFNSYGTFLMNQGVFTTMSYNDGWASTFPSGFAAYGSQATPMALDIALLQQRYGVNTTTGLGDTTYTLPTANGAGTLFQCIWDNGGVDAIVYSGSAAATIDLRPASLLNAIGGGGYVSAANTIRGGFTIANGVVIENAEGGSGNDTLVGNDVANILNGGSGADNMSGNGGDDTFYVDNAGDVTSDSVGGGIDTVFSTVTHQIGANIENLTLTGAGFSNGTGNASDNTLTGNVQANALTGFGGNDTLIGNEGNDALNGGEGNDTLNGGVGADGNLGGTGDDTFVIDDAGDTITENVGEGTDTVQTSLAYTLGANLENLTLTGTADLNGTGNTFNNAITGNSGVNALSGLDGNDTLDGGLGADAMAGGIGDDTYFVDNGGDVVTENASEGTDTVRSTVGVAALAANVENLILLGVAVTGNGNALNNAITGNASNNSINGQAGADTMAGGLGNDTYFVDDLADVVTESSGQGTDIIFSTVNVAALAANVENLTISALALTATGNALNNTIAGNAQNNTLNGGSGEDTLIGGIGNDLYIVNSLGDVVTEGLGAGTDSILAFINIDALVANVENVTLAGAATSATGNELSNILTGNGLDNTLVGGLGGDQLNGGTGADTLSGGGGDDAYLVENAGDVVIELGGEGNNDIVYAFISLGTLADNVERVTITGVGDLNISGNSLGNRVNGNANNNVLLGLDGNDVIQGLAGTDTINGGAGLDLMTGGADADTFVFSLVSDSGTTGATRDVINDFAQGSDIISLTGIDAITGGGDDAFTLIGTAAFSNTAGELRYDQIDNPTGNDFTILSLDVNGDGIADSQITLIGLVTLTVSDFGL